MSLEMIENLIALCAKADHERFEQSIADKPPIERLILRRARKKALELRAEEDREAEDLMLNGNGSGVRPVGVIYANCESRG